MQKMAISQLIRALALGTGLACIGLMQAGAQGADQPSVRGAIYVPYKAYNAPQMWKNFSVEETRRDFGYAHELHLNALRIWGSYEYWKMEPARFETSLNQLLATAKNDHIRVLFVLFENDGVPPTPENMWTTDPQKAYCIQSPGKSIASFADKAAWEPPRAFVQWFMKKYANDNRLIGIEVMNEPGPETVDFAKSMFTTAHTMQGTVPLTIGAARLQRALEFLPLGERIIEFHQNFPPNLAVLDKEIEAAMAAGKEAHVPVWLTEWQRVRPGGSGFGDQKVAETEMQIDYASLAGEVRKYPIGNFFWSLMVKPAYLKGQRSKGTVNGLFWPDGSVASLRDARAIANDNGIQLKEKPIPPGFVNVPTTEAHVPGAAAK